jgi:hypothetical protein
MMGWTVDGDLPVLRPSPALPPSFHFSLDLCANLFSHFVSLVLHFALACQSTTSRGADKDTHTARHFRRRTLLPAKVAA